MQLRYSTDPPYNPHDPEMWNLMAVPERFRNWEEDIDNAEKLDKSASLFTQLLGDVFGSVPFVGGLFKAFSNFGLSAFNRNLQEDANWRNKMNARYADWYNSPQQQVLRLRKAGINPYVKDGVKTIPSIVPTYDPYLTPLQAGNTESLAGLINAFTNAKVASARIDNLDSLTAINEYKEENLLPQLFDRNVYLNSILELQVAWETDNYTKERQLKQNLLDISYRQAVVELGQGIMENSADMPNSKTYVDVEQGKIYVDYIDENGNAKTIDLADVPFDRLPPYLQKIYNDIAVKRDLARSTVEVNSAQAKTTSMLGLVYNSRKQQLDFETADYKKTGFWRSDDPVLRAFAGVASTEAVWKRFGLGVLDDAAGTALDVSSAYLNPTNLSRVLQGNKPVSLPSSPKPLNIPRGSTPYMIGNQPYYYWK